LLIEHGHRQLAAVIGFIAIITAVVAWRTETRRWVAWLAIALLAAVIGQGVLGGIRVVLSDRTFAMIHGCVGPMFFGICVALAVVTGRWWTDRAKTIGEVRISRSLVVLGVAVAVLAYGQLVLGAQLRHVQATASPIGFAHLVRTHIVGAFLLWAMTAVLAWRLSRLERGSFSRIADMGSRSLVSAEKNGRSNSEKNGCGDLTLSPPASLLVGFVGLQIALGGSTWVVNYGWPQFAQLGGWSASYLVKSKAFVESFITTAHVATGSLILAMAVMLTIRLARSRWMTLRGQTIFADTASSREKSSSPSPTKQVGKISEPVEAATERNRKLQVT